MNTDDLPELNYEIRTPLGREQLSHRRPTNLPYPLFGVCYYPEHWDKETRAGDPERLADLGCNTIRMADFSWAVFERREDEYDFSLFDETIEKMADVGIKTIMCTPTAAPPRWLTFKYPEILRENLEGHTMMHGSRQHADLHHPIFRHYSRKITKVLAEHYRDNPNVIGWQTDNEFYCHYDQDHSPAAQENFRTYLRVRYDKNIQKLNDAWGTQFWAQVYSSFEEIETPKPNLPCFDNPSQQFDYFHFLSDSATSFQREQVEILRSTQPKWFVFHNGVFSHINWRGAFTQDLDFLAYDIYPFFHSKYQDRCHTQSFNCDRVRSLSGNFLVPEHQSGAGGQIEYFHNQPEPGEIRLMTWRSVAHGADGILYFRERTLHYGAEQFWEGILDPDNQPRRRFKEIARIGKEWKRVGDAIANTEVMIDCAVAHADYDVESSHESSPLGLPSPDQAAKVAHRCLWRRNLAVGCVHPSDDLSNLKLYIIPHWSLFRSEWVGPLTAWVKKGGTLVVGARSGTLTAENQLTRETYPGCLREFVGSGIEEFGRQNPDSDRQHSLKIEGRNQLVPTTSWYEVLKPEGNTEVWACWDTRFLKGLPAITSKKHGKGRVIYVGTWLDENVCEALLPNLAQECGIQPLIPDIPEGVEIVCRSHKNRKIWFLMNNTDSKVRLPKIPEGIHLSDTDIEKDGSVQLEQHGVLILQTLIRS